MIRVAFWFDAPLGYSGGLNYLQNLLHALSSVNDGSVKPFIFFSSKAPEAVTRAFEPYATVVRTAILQRRTLSWFFHKVLYKVFHSMAMVNRLLQRYDIDVVSHAWYIYKGKPPFKVIAWIPDFQYLHLPELFPNLNPAEETEVNRAIVAQADAVVLSSAHAYQDFLRVAAPEHHGRGRVLRFVCQPSHAGSSDTPSIVQLEAKYGFAGPYFLLPNQFWTHKNHMLVLQAVATLKRRGINVQVLCTGNTKDYRVSGTPYVDSLAQFIAEHELGSHVRILGMIDYADLLVLMRHAIGVINPSRFEGWSSSVEEARSMGKTILLSRIPVHEEQAPPDAHYFAIDDEEALAAALASVAAAYDQSRHAAAEQAALAQLKQRTEAFGRQYLQLLKQVHGGRSAP